MSRMTTIALFTFAGMVAVGCGTTTTTTPEIAVEMVGVFEQPKTAKGNVTPQSQVYTIDGLSILKSNGDSVKLLTSSKSIKVVNRPQMVLTAPLADYKDMAFTRASITFNAAVATTTRKNAELVSALTTLTYDSDTTFTVEATSSIRLVLKVKWGNTVTQDEATGAETVGAPDFGFTVE